MTLTRTRAAAFAGVCVAVGALAFVPARASSHREAPLISQDPLADNTDLYAFVSPATPDKVTIIANFIPLEAPYGGPNFYKFDDNVLYEIKIDNNGDAREDVTYQFQFKTSVRDGDTFLYNTGPITSLDSPAWNVRQSYTVSKVLGDRGFGNGRAVVMGSNLPTPPVNIGLRSTPNYDALAAAAVQDLDGGVRVFAGQRDDPFFVDLNVFDLLAVPPADVNNSDSLAGYNVHTIAIEVPIASLTSNGLRPQAATDPHAVIGIWSTASRPNVTTQKNGKATGTYVQVSRLGQPLVNEVVIPRAAKDLFNSIAPTEDAAALPFVLDPEVPKLLSALFGIQSPPSAREDLVTIFLTGIPGLNQPPGVRPSEMLRLNTAVPPVLAPNPMGVLGGDIAGFPNGRRLTDDVVDIALRAMAGATPLTAQFNQGINAQLGDGVSGNDKPFLTVFPYVAAPHAGNK
jgi:hypothetical protein